MNGNSRMDSSQQSCDKVNSSEIAFTDWRKLFAAAEYQTLQFFPLKRSEGKVRVSLSIEVFEEGEMLWKNAVVAQFVGRIPNFRYF